MRIERIELNGFKSFADRTVLDMHAGITAIVGPNGCGKSNVVDAIRWVLGEQSAKNLRGGKMEEVIFNGTERKKQKGMAEVSLLLSGISRETPTGMPVDEIRVTRRLYRSGESEYMINNNPCRLRDIRDIFLDTGLELKSYAILEQGRVGDIINSKPVDRRFLIEEAAGVVKYKVRKQEAVSKLESAKNNLQRIMDIVAEVRRQKNAIERQARKAERYKVLAEEAKGLELGISRQAFDRVGGERTTLSTSRDALRLEEAESAAALEGREAELEKRRIEMADEEQAIETAQQRIYVLEKGITEMEGRVELLRTEKKNLEERVERSGQREEELKDREERLDAERNTLQSREQELLTAVEEFRSRLDEGIEGVKKVEQELLDLEEQIDGERRNLFAGTERLAHAANELTNLQREIDEGRHREERAVREAAGVEEERVGAQQRLEGIGRDRENTLAERDGQVADRASVQGSLQTLRQSLAEREADHDQAREASVAARSRLSSLREMEANLTGYREGIRRLVQGKGSEHDLDIRGLLADAMDVPAEMESAIEAVLGERLQSLVMADHGEAQRALDYLRKNDYGRGVFVPQTARPVSVEVDLPEGDGVLGPAASLVRPREPYGAVVANLLAQVVVVRDLDTAFSLWERASVTLVTLEGEVLEPSGLLYGGAEKGLLSMKRQIRDLEEDVASRDERARALAAEIVELKTGGADLEEALRKKEEEIRNLEGALQEIRHREETAGEAVRQLGSRLELIETERLEAEAAAQRFREQLEERKKIREELWNSKTRTEENIEGLQTELVRKKRLLADLKDRATDRRVDYNARKASLESLKEQKDRLSTALQEASGQRTQLLEARARMVEAIETTQEGISETAHRLSEQVGRAKEETDALRERKGRFNEKAVEMRGIEETVRKRRPELDGLRSRIGELDVRGAQLDLELEHVIQRIRENYGLEIDTVEPTEVADDAEDRLGELRARMSAMGPVSLGSLEEHEELTERYEFLLKQQEDLNQSISTLQEAISKINRTTRERLRTAYEQLRENFQKSFKHLFGGGRADLQLVGEDSILEAGIEIVAQPPGKRLQNITLLSGGEKALTAISLLFAGFLIKPSPLCVLDEVDAPLDETNTDKFASMLGGMAGDTQFVTITHNRRTMEQADILYGVTMEEAGVSKLLSMKMAEYAEV